MKTSENGIKLLKQFEGCRLAAYILPGEHYYTIGYGHHGPDVAPGMVISQIQAEMLLKVDLEKYEKLVEQYVRDIELTQNRFDALVSYTYNRGSGGIKQLSENCHTAEEYSEGFLIYWGSAQKYKDALLKRRTKERELFDKPSSDEMHEVAPESAVDRVIGIAEAEVGYLEKKDGNNLYDKLANAGDKNYTKYGKEMHDLYPKTMDYPAPWCDAFVDWCFYKAFGVTNAKKFLGGDFDDYTVQSAQLYMSKGAYFYPSQGKPKRGDQIFFHNGKRICHTGLVTAVDNRKVYTIEGNTSGGEKIIPNGGEVCRKSYDLTNQRIHGYGSPAYDIADKFVESLPHLQLNYRQGETYRLDADLNVRNSPGSMNDGNKTGYTLSRGVKVMNLATTRQGDKIWMLIDPKMIVDYPYPYAWICADSGVKAYAQEIN